MIRVVATFQLKPGNVPKALEIAKPLIEMTRKEKGCVQYDLAKSTADENVLVMLEAWEDKESLDAHSVSDHYKSAVPQMVALCTGAPVVSAYIQLI